LNQFNAKSGAAANHDHSAMYRGGDALMGRPVTGRSPGQPGAPTGHDGV